MALAVVRNLGAPPGLRSEQDIDDFEQEIVDQYALAMAAAGLTDDHIAGTRAVVVEFAQSLPGRVWTATVDDSDRFLAGLRRRGQARSTIANKAGVIAHFYDFVITRYQGDVHRLVGWVVVQPIDEYNRPTRASSEAERVPPGDDEVEELFTQWGKAVVHARKYLPAARDYFAASLWRRLGLRITESVMLDIRDWRPDLGRQGKLHVRYGKGSGGRGPKPRLVPAINSADALIDWWLAEVRPRYGPDWEDPDAPMLPSERVSSDVRRRRVGAEALRVGLAKATSEWLPAWSNGRLTPHVLRHYCASSLYGRGMDLKAVQELLGHEWLSTTTRYCTCAATTSNEPGPTPTSESPTGSSTKDGEPMRWNMRMKAAERGIWKSTELRRRLAEAGLEISAGKMSALWTGTPTTVRLDDLDVICAVLECTPDELLILEPDKVAGLRPRKVATSNEPASPRVVPRLARERPAPPA